jgi:hypothetical protein
VDAKNPRLVRRSGDNTTTAASSWVGANDDGLADQRQVAQPFDGYIEGIEIDVKDRSRIGHDN